MTWFREKQTESLPYIQFTYKWMDPHPPNTNIIDGEEARPKSQHWVDRVRNRKCNLVSYCHGICSLSNVKKVVKKIHTCRGLMGKPTVIINGIIKLVISIFYVTEKRGEITI